MEEAQPAVTAQSQRLSGRSTEHFLRPLNQEQLLWPSLETAAAKPIQTNIALTWRDSQGWSLRERWLLA